MEPRIDKGPLEVLAALIADDSEALKEAVKFQRESFKAKFRCYPEDMKSHELTIRRGLYQTEGLCSCGEWRSGQLWGKGSEIEALIHETFATDHVGG